MRTTVAGIESHHTQFEVSGTLEEEECPGPVRRPLAAALENMGTPDEIREVEGFPEVGAVPLGEGVRRNRFEKIPKKKWVSFKCNEGCGCEGTSKLIQAVEAKHVRFADGGKKMCLSFQVADVQKPLVSVKRIVEKGNLVSFGPKDEDNYVLSKSTGDKLMLRPNGKGS